MLQRPYEKMPTKNSAVNDAQLLLKVLAALCARDKAEKARTGGDVKCLGQDPGRRGDGTQGVRA